MIENSEIGIKAAKSAKCMVIANQDHQFEQKQELTDNCIINFNDLINTIKVL